MLMYMALLLHADIVLCTLLCVAGLWVGTQQPWLLFRLVMVLLLGVVLLVAELWVGTAQHWLIFRLVMILLLGVVGKVILLVSFQAAGQASAYHLCGLFAQQPRAAGIFRFYMRQEQHAHEPSIGNWSAATPAVFIKHLDKAVSIHGNMPSDEV